jgi:hypothetical protein
MKRIALIAIGCLVLVGCATIPPGEQPQIIQTSPASKAKIFTALNGKFQTYGYALDICTLEGGMIQTTWKDLTSTAAQLFGGNRNEVRYTVTLSGDSISTTIRGTGQTRSTANTIAGSSQYVYPRKLSELKDLEKIILEAKVIAETQ